MDFMMGDLLRLKTGRYFIEDNLFAGLKFFSRNILPGSI